MLDVELRYVASIADIVAGLDCRRQMVARRADGTVDSALLLGPAEVSCSSCISRIGGVLDIYSHRWKPLSLLAELVCNVPCSAMVDSCIPFTVQRLHRPLHARRSTKPTPTTQTWRKTAASAGASG